MRLLCSCRHDDGREVASHRKDARVAVRHKFVPAESIVLRELVSVCYRSSCGSWAQTCPWCVCLGPFTATIFAAVVQVAVPRTVTHHPTPSPAFAAVDHHPACTPRSGEQPTYTHVEPTDHTCSLPV